MSETYLVLLLGAIAGLAGALIGGMILYRNRLRTHLMFRERVEAERTALYTELSEIEKEELAQTDAGKDLMASSQGSIQRFGYPHESSIVSLRRQNYDLLKQIDAQKKRFAESEDRLAALDAVQQEAAKAIENLKKENTELRLAHSLREDTASASTIQLEQDLRSTLQEVARLQNQLAESNMRLIEVEAGAITSFSKELHQTLSASLESLDLLLNESVGGLNAVQRNLLETVKASTARLYNVIGDFIQLTAHKTNSPTHEQVDLKSVVEEAITETSSQIRAKRITLNADVPEDTTPVYTDREALRQILIRLLSNAGAISPLQGTVFLRVKTRAEDDEQQILMQVSDTGGGIPPEDLPRVFVPSFRLEDVPARGVGETGMGLFIVKTLTEQQHGKIWVDSEPGIGSVYNVLIPIDRDKPVSESVDK